MAKPSAIASHATMTTRLSASLASSESGSAFSALHESSVMIVSAQKENFLQSRQPTSGCNSPMSRHFCPGNTCIDVRAKMAQKRYSQSECCEADFGNADFDIALSDSVQRI
ncbi:hypothetical protein [Mesorhizobium onobrychidis]|uniref:Uncharacterized protein n=1 Tax=Mesorhizobium onobrychidis TaxID=2775404 RepID=A0ABY5R1V5_9HYPH|nr:hypothetical protein [Mesorhizobium onobrychidis]UVC17408.1 hypothetical protein IHQ72_09910 [Mesorhizobium onobrychidis]